MALLAAALLLPPSLVLLAVDGLELVEVRAAVWTGRRRSGSAGPDRAVPRYGDGERRQDITGHGEERKERGNSRVRMMRTFTRSGGPGRPRPRPLPVAASYLSRRAHDPSAPVAPSGWCSRFASPAAAAPPSATPPPLFTLDDRFAAADFSPDPTASSPSPRVGAGAGSRSPSWDRSRGKASAPGSPMDGVVEPPPRKELLALPLPSSPCTPPPPTATAVTPATEAARTEPAAPASEGKADGEEWVTVFGTLTMPGKPSKRMVSNYAVAS
ncbi:nascent polypeptide-associated complex subunit alpha, muscle-specific form-like [Triticum aestivum]|uniref:nascent polypeptide-associated complex subunit alpha, muscle-specific form-like n=1 Tax=Triticum aestivum TaxID=4565 RepID=UPI001D0325A3|nr:nascent polypeptide-associated complex subunit alpha, muscle-specific form-like [Triticum aestivum]